MGRAQSLACVRSGCAYTLSALGNHSSDHCHVSKRGRGQNRTRQPVSGLGLQSALHPLRDRQFDRGACLHRHLVWLHRLVRRIEQLQRSGPRSYLQGHSALSRASTRHSGGKGLRTGSDLIPDRVPPIPLERRAVPGCPDFASRRSGPWRPRGRNGGQPPLVTRPRRLAGISRTTPFGWLQRVSGARRDETSHHQSRGTPSWLTMWDRSWLPISSSCPGSRTVVVRPRDPRADRRRIVHVAVTDHPTAAWTAQQLRNALPEDHAPRDLLHDRDAVFTDVTSTIGAMQIHEIVTAPRSLWQNAYVERLIGSIEVSASIT